MSLLERERDDNNVVDEKLAQPRKTQTGMPWDESETLIFQAPIGYNFWWSDPVSQDEVEWQQSA